MTKADLKTGMIVTLRNGLKYMVLKDISTCYTHKDCIVSINMPLCWNGLEYYNEDLTYKGINESCKEEDIVKVEQVEHPCYFQSSYDNKNKLRLLWERTEVKEVTMAEVEEKFGCKVKIINQN